MSEFGRSAIPLQLNPDEVLPQWASKEMSTRYLVEMSFNRMSLFREIINKCKALHGSICEAQRVASQCSHAIIVLIGGGPKDFESLAPT